MAFIKLSSGLRNEKVGEVLWKRCHLGVCVPVCACVCRLRFSECISSMNLQKCVAVWTRCTVKSCSFGLWDSWANTTTEAQGYFPPLWDLCMQTSQSLQPVSIHPLDDWKKQGCCNVLSRCVKVSRRVGCWASCHAAMRDIDSRGQAEDSKPRRMICRRH